MLPSCEMLRAHAGDFYPAIAVALSMTINVLITNYELPFTNYQLPLTSALGLLYILHTHFAHSARRPARISPRRAENAGVFSASAKGCPSSCAAPSIKYHGCKCPSPPITL